MRRISGVILIIVVAIGLFIIGRHSPFGAVNSVFHVKNTDKVTRILIMKENETVELENEPDGWQVNGKYTVRPSAMQSILRMIGDIRIKSPVSESIFNSITINNNTQLVEVKIFGGRRLVQSFLIYRHTSPEFPCIMQKRKNRKPFFVHIPGYETDPGMYFVADEKYWRSNTVFELRPEKIEEIHLKYFETPDSSFTILFKGREILFTGGKNNKEDIDTMATGRYLSYFTYVPLESWVPDMSRVARDSITKATPYFKLNVLSSDQDTISLLIWVRRMKDRDSMVEDTDRLWGSLNGGEDLFIIKYYYLDPLIKGPSYFISD